MDREFNASIQQCRCCDSGVLCTVQLGIIHYLKLYSRVCLAGGDRNGIRKSNFIRVIREKIHNQICVGSRTHGHHTGHCTIPLSDWARDHKGYFWRQIAKIDAIKDLPQINTDHMRPNHKTTPLEHCHRIVILSCSIHVASVRADRYRTGPIQAIHSVECILGYTDIGDLPAGCIPTEHRHRMVILPSSIHVASVRADRHRTGTIQAIHSVDPVFYHTHIG